MRYIKIVGFLALDLFALAGAFKPEFFTFLNGVNILFHEAGHLFFMPLGHYWHVWGGTLNQLIIPFGIGLAFWLRGQKASACVMFWWLGQNFFGISSYIKDARAQVLPFIGGEEHDWEFILSAHHWLLHDQAIGNFAWTVGLLLMLSATSWGIYFVCREDFSRSH